eukprot:934830_1
MPSQCVAVVDTKDTIHILSGLQTLFYLNDKKDCKHYSISISSVLKDILDNEDEDEKHDMQSEEMKQALAKEDHAKAIETIDELTKQNAHLQSLVCDLLKNNKTEELTEETKTINKLKSEAIQSNDTINNLKRDKKEALAQLDSLRTENEAVKRVHMKAMERMTQLSRENSALSEECKEKTLELHRVSAELSQLRARA